MRYTTGRQLKNAVFRDQARDRAQRHQSQRRPRHAHAPLEYENLVSPSQARRQRRPYARDDTSLASLLVAQRFDRIQLRGAVGRVDPGHQAHRHRYTGREYER